MQKTEKVFIFIIVIVGFLFLYIMSIFMDFGGSTANYDAPIIQEIEDSDLELDDEDLDISSNVRRSRLKKITYQEPYSSVEDDYETIPRPAQIRQNTNALQNSIREQIKASEISLSEQESLLSKDLARKGFTNPRFINMQIAALNTQPYKKHRYKIKQMELKGDFKLGIKLIDKILEETSSENYLLLGEIYKKAYELALQSGSIKLIDKYSKMYLKNTETTLNIFRDSRFSETHKGRETIYQLTQQLKKAQSGNVATLFALVGSKEVSSLGLLTSLKASAKINSNEGAFSISNDDIEQASSHTKSIFKNIQP